MKATIMSLWLTVFSYVDNIVLSQEDARKKWEKFMDDGLEPIIQYKMTELEAKAYKFTLIWEKCIKKEIPDYHFKTRKGDPRKSSIFKYCYKLAVETKNQIPDEQYKLYILAQIQMMKILSNGDLHALVTPTILVGDKAWIRWKIWLRKYNKICKNKEQKEQEKDNKQRIITAVKDSKNYLTAKLGEITEDTIKKSIESEKLFQWASTQKISPYYILICPIINKLLHGDLSIFKFDLDVYKSSIDKDLEQELIILLK